MRVSLRSVGLWGNNVHSWHSCSKLTISLVNEMLHFQTLPFLAKKGKNYKISSHYISKNGRALDFGFTSRSLDESVTEDVT